VDGTGGRGAYPEALRGPNVIIAAEVDIDAEVVV
jgi:hypothetical protein